MANKPTKLQKSTAILKNAKATQWCYVNIDNEFKFMNKTFVIDDSVKEYKVYNKAFEVEDYTNEAYMEEILVVVDNEDRLSFYDQNYEQIENRLVRVKE